MYYTLTKWLCVFTVFSCAFGQVTSPGRHQPLRHWPVAKTYRVPTTDTEIRTDLWHDETGPMRFAVAIPVDVTVRKEEGQVLNTQGDWVWRLRIESPGALSISLLFDRWQIPDDTEIYVYSEHHTLGAFTSVPSNKPNGHFAIAPLPGDTLTIEYFSVGHVVERPHIHLYKIAHGYRLLPSILPNTHYFDSSVMPMQHSLLAPQVESGWCNVDLACDPAGTHWEAVARSVAILLTDDHQMYCTGTLLNNVRGDGRQLFMTARHCMAASEPTTDMVLFNHKRRSCGGGKSAPSPPLTDTVHGIRLLAHHISSDYVLYEIQEPIPKSYHVHFAGWSTMDYPYAPLVCIHHPNGDVKKMSIFEGRLRKTCWDECPFRMHWKINHWTRGTTEPGSSGAPLFDQNHRMVGQLHGGSASCRNSRGYDIFGALRFSWHLGLRAFLDPDDSNIQVLDGIDQSALPLSHT